MGWGHEQFKSPRLPNVSTLGAGGSPLFGGLEGVGPVVVVAAVRLAVGLVLCADGRESRCVRRVNSAESGASLERISPDRLHFLLVGIIRVYLIGVHRGYPCFVRVALARFLAGHANRIIIGERQVEAEGTRALRILGWVGSIELVILRFLGTTPAKFVCSAREEFGFG